MCRTRPRSTSSSILRQVFMKFSWMYGFASALREVTSQPRRMEVRKRPMHEIEIKIIQAQVGKRLAAGSDDIVLAVLVVPQLRGDPQLLAANVAAHLFQRAPISSSLPYTDAQSKCR